MANRPVARQRQVRPRHLPLGAPPRAWALSEWALLPLRAFLGGTFLYAGLQKLANPDFFSSTSTSSIHAQLVASARFSPIGGLIAHLEGLATPVGISIAVGEVAIGLGTLLGLWGRVAAVAGALLSFMLFLTVSFHSSPYFTGADIVFFFAWTALIASGSGAHLSIDGIIAKRAARESAQPGPEMVAIPFTQVQHFCGHYQKGHCRAQHGAPCGPSGCPVLEGPRASLVSRGAPDHVDRRMLMLGATSVGIFAVAGGLLSGVAAGVGRLLHGSRASSTKTITSTPTTTGGSNSSLGTKLGSASQVSIGQAATFTVPSSGDPGIVICTGAGSFVGYDTICPHNGCTVGFSPNSNVLVCPCHGSQFLVSNGNVISGPANSGLLALTVSEGTDGNLYVK